MACCVATHQSGRYTSSGFQRKGCSSGVDRFVFKAVAASSPVGLAIRSFAFVPSRGHATSPARLLLSLLLAETARIIQRRIQIGPLIAARTRMRRSVILYQDLPPRSVPAATIDDKTKHQVRSPAQILVSVSGILQSSSEKIWTNLVVETGLEAEGPDV